MEQELLPFIEGVQPLVPQEWCLSCRGCCRFADPTDAQTPTLSPVEVRWACEAGAQAEWFPPLATAPSRGIAVVPHEGGFRCPALEPCTHHCRVYPKRPFDCRLYPFVVTRDRSRQRLLLAADPKCPYVQQLGPSPAMRDYGAYVARLLDAAPGQALLTENPALAGRWRDEFWVLHSLNDPAPSGPAPAPEGFQPLDTAFEAFEACLDRAGRPLSAYTKAAWWPWRDLMRLWWGSLEAWGCLLVEQAGGYFLGLPPLGPSVTPKVVERAFELLQRLNGGSGVSRIENVPIELAEPLRDFGYVVRQVDQEYLYDRRQLAERLGVQARRAARDLTIRPYRPEDAERCRRLYMLWALRRQAATEDPPARAMVRDGFYAHRRWLEDAASLGLYGLVAERQGEIVGYTLGAALTPEVFVVLAEIAALDTPALPAALAHALCQSVGAQWINAMGDAGLPTVARAKRQLGPAHLKPVLVAGLP